MLSSLKLAGQITLQQRWEKHLKLQLSNQKETSYLEDLDVNI